MNWFHPPMRKRVRIIANPISGRGRAKRTARDVERLLVEWGCQVEVVETRCPGDAKRIASESAGIDVLVAVGGDGTVNEVVNGLPEKDAPAIAMIPSGTANVLAKELHLPSDAAGIADVISGGREISWDLGIERVSGRKFLLFVSAGFDAQVVHDFHRQRKGRVHMADYVWWGVRTFAEFRIPAIRVELDGKLVEERASWVVVSNVASYGGPIAFTPNARYDDGRFEVMIQRGRHHMDIVNLFASSFTSWATTFQWWPRDVSYHPATRVRLTQGETREVAAQVDGDPGGFLPVDLEVIPGGVKVLGPR